MPAWGESSRSATGLAESSPGGQRVLDGPPREKSLLPWLYVAVWSLLIFATIPLARTIQQFVARQWGREAFTLVVVVAILAALLFAAALLRRRRTTWTGYFWLVLVAAVFLHYTFRLGQKSPEEALHFIQYGVLGVLAWRALSHRLQDYSVYLAAAVVCGFIGTLDEVIQWLTPRRFWGLRDIWINFLAASLVQMAIALGLKPGYIRGWPNLANLRYLCRLTILGLALLAASLANTPARIGWYAERIPGLGFLKANESMMQEYGYLYRDPDIGLFRSRLAPAELRRTDLERAAEAAGVLDRFRSRSQYHEFLTLYTPVTDPFLHEARVHLFSRDFNFAESRRLRADPALCARSLTIAFRENQILEKYFPRTLGLSTYVRPPDDLALARRHLLADQVYESGVSSSLVTSVSEGQVNAGLTLLMLALALAHWRLGRPGEGRPA